MYLEKKKSNKKIIISSIIVSIVLIGVVGVTFALWSYSKVGPNQELISGNIYMKYTETNQINAQGMMPLDISKYYSEGYIVNPNMTKEELASCESFFSGEDWISGFQNEETPRAFCEGTGTAQGGITTFQDLLVGAPQEIIEQQYGELIENNVIIKEGFRTKYEHYKVNPSMTSEELASCESFFEEKFSQMFQNEETPRAFCKGTGTAQGDTLQEVLNSLSSSSKIEQAFGELIEKNVIQKETIELPKVPYFEFNIEGINDYTKDIWYEIVLSHGEEPEDRDTRIKDYLLRFRLVEVVNGQEKEIFTNRNYGDLSKEKIWVDTVSAQTEEVKRVYRLYMWIGNETTIGNTEGADYDNETWERVYASIKVNVNGDFTPKEVNYSEYIPPQPARCFMTQEFEHNGDTEVMITDYDTDCGTKVNIPEKINGHKVTVIGSFSMYNNEGYIQPMAFSPNTNEMSFYNKGLTSVIIPNTVRTIGNFAFADNNLTKVEIPDSVEWIDIDAFSDNQLEIVTIGSGIKYIGDSAFNYNGEYGDYGNYGTFKTLKVKKSCEEIKNIPESFEQQYTYYPWTCSAHKDGLKVYGYENGEEKFCEVAEFSCAE